MISNKSMPASTKKDTCALSHETEAEYFSATIESLSVDRALRIHGYKAPDRVPERLRSITGEVLAELETQIDGQVAFHRIPIRRLGARELILEDGSRFSCKAFRHFLADCREVVLFVQSLGESVEALRQRLSENGLVLEGLILETGGWLAIEQLTRSFARYLRAYHGESVNLTRRLAPGYSFKTPCGEVTWDLEEQQALFSALDAVDFPVRLLHGCSMVPKLSRSGLYGIRDTRSAAMAAADEATL